MKNLYLQGESTRHIAFTLNEPIWGEMTDVLPGVQNIFLDSEAPGPAQEVIERFAAARQLSGHTIAVSLWDVDWCMINLFLGVNDLSALRFQSFVAFAFHVIHYFSCICIWPYPINISRNCMDTLIFSSFIPDVLLCSTVV